jgi:hypothetical protein
MLSTSPDTFLSVVCPIQLCHIRSGINCTQKDRFKLCARAMRYLANIFNRRTCLIHPSIGEEQSGVIVRYRGGRRDEGVSLRAEVVKKLLANVGCGPMTRISMGGHPARAHESRSPRASHARDGSPAGVICHVTRHFSARCLEYPLDCYHNSSRLALQDVSPSLVISRPPPPPFERTHCTLD